MDDNSNLLAERQNLNWWLLNVGLGKLQGTAEEIGRALSRVCWINRRLNDDDEQPSQKGAVDVTLR